MTVKEAVLAAKKEIILPELQTLKQEQAEMKTALVLTNQRLADMSQSLNKRLDDVNAHLVDQSRRIDETNKRMDSLHADLLARIDETNRSVTRLYEVIVRREEVTEMGLRLRLLEQEMEALKKRLAA